MTIYKLGFDDWPVSVMRCNAGESWEDLLRIPADEFSKRFFKFDIFDEKENDRRSAELPDIVFAQPGVLAVSDSLNDLLEILSDGCCRIATMCTPFEPVTEYKVVLPENSADVFDSQNSRFKRFPSSGEIMHVTQWAIKKNPVVRWPIFRIKIENDVHHDIFVNQEFVDIYEGAKGTGLKFKKIVAS